MWFFVEWVTPREGGRLMEKTAATTAYATERLDHLGIVAGVCREIGLAEFLDAQAAGSRQKVSVGTATVAMVLNGSGFSNRRLYLVSQFFENKPLERLLGVPGIEAADLDDDCLGRTLDWLYAHDVTRLFAGIAVRARRAFGIEEPSRVHVDTTSFSVSGEYEAAREEEGGEEATIAVTYGYPRDHRADLEQWMCWPRPPPTRATCRRSCVPWTATARTPAASHEWSRPT